MSDPYVLTVELDPEDTALLEHASKIEKLNKSEVVRRALRDFVRRLPTPTPPLQSSSKKPRRAAA
jgi:hypothetical protein